MPDDVQPTPAGESLDRDLLCLDCDYNLRGLRPGGNCPECGQSIAATLERERLWPGFAPRPKLLRWALWLLVGSQLLAGGLAQLMFWFDLIPQPSPAMSMLLVVDGHEPWTPAALHLDKAGPLPVIFVVLPIALQIVGIWLLCSRLHLRDFPQRRWDSRPWLAGLALLPTTLALLYSCPGLLESDARPLLLMILLQMPVDWLLALRAGKLARQASRPILAWSFWLVGAGIVLIHIPLAAHAASLLMFYDFKRFYFLQTLAMLAPAVKILACLNLAWLTLLMALAVRRFPRAVPARSATGA